ncbi:MAG: hypothetical protein CMP38_03995 [Rickettsiales bacterium]|nr:hypothetical protein [Rickettsiales bacterium]
MVKVLIFIFALLIFVSIFFFTKKISKRSSLLNLVFIFLIFLSLVVFFINNKNESEKKYYPPKFDGEIVIPGYFDEN